MQKRTTKIRKTKFYVEFIKFYKCPLTGFEPRTPSSDEFLNFEVRKPRFQDSQWSALEGLQTVTIMVCQWPYFQSLKNRRSTARKALKLFWLNAQHSEVFKMVWYALLAHLDHAQSCLKVTKNLLFSVKMTKNKPFLLKKANF